MCVTHAGRGQDDRASASGLGPCRRHRRDRGAACRSSPAARCRRAGRRIAARRRLRVARSRARARAQRWSPAVSSSGTPLVAQAVRPVMPFYCQGKIPRVIRRFALVLAVAAAAAGCRREPPAPAAERFDRAPIVLISIDTLRADQLPAYGYRGGSTPAIDRLGQRRHRLRGRLQPLPADAAVARLALHRPPAAAPRRSRQHRLHRRGRRAHARRATSRRPATHRRRRLRRTCCGGRPGSAAASISSTTRSRWPGPASRWPRRSATAARTVDALAAWIDANAGTPVFAFLHLYEPHTPYAPPPAHRDGATPYDGEIAYADELVGACSIGSTRAAPRPRDRRGRLRPRRGARRPRRGGARHLALPRGAARALDHAAAGRPARRHARRRHGRDWSTSRRRCSSWPALPVDGMDGQSAGGGAPADAARRSRPSIPKRYYPRLHFGWSDLASRDRRPLSLHSRAAARAVRSSRPIRRERAQPRGVDEIRRRRRWRAGSIARRARRRAAAAAGAGDGRRPRAAARARLRRLRRRAPLPRARRCPIRRTRSRPTRRSSAALSARRAQAATRKRSRSSSRSLARESSTCSTRWELLAKSLVKVGRTREAIEAFGKVHRDRAAEARDPPGAGAHLRARTAAGRARAARGARRAPRSRRPPTKSSPS